MSRTYHGFRPRGPDGAGPTCRPDNHAITIAVDAENPLLWAIRCERCGPLGLRGSWVRARGLAQVHGGRWRDVYRPPKGEWDDS